MHIGIFIYVVKLFTKLKNHETLVSVWKTLFTRAGYFEVSFFKSKALSNSVDSRIMVLLSMLVNGIL